MRMANEQPALQQPEQFLLGSLGNRPVGGVDDLLVANPAIERGAAVAQDLAIDLGPELLGAKQHDVEVPAPGRDIHQRIAEAAIAA